MSDRNTGCGKPGILMPLIKKTLTIYQDEYWGMAPSEHWTQGTDLILQKTPQKKRPSYIGRIPLAKYRIKHQDNIYWPDTGLKETDLTDGTTVTSFVPVWIPRKIQQTNTAITDPDLPDGTTGTYLTGRTTSTDQTPGRKALALQIRQTRKTGTYLLPGWANTGERGNATPLLTMILITRNTKKSSYWCW